MRMGMTLCPIGPLIAAKLALRSFVSDQVLSLIPDACLASSLLAVSRQPSWPVRDPAGFAVDTGDNLNPAT